MAEKSKEQLKAEEYFKQNGIECDKNFVYVIRACFKTQNRQYF